MQDTSLSHAFLCIFDLKLKSVHSSGLTASSSFVHGGKVNPRPVQLWYILTWEIF